MKQLLPLGGLAALLLLLPVLTHAQGVGIGTTAPDASAALDIVSSSKGVLLPRLPAATRLGMGSPAAGLIVFQTDSPTTGVGSGTQAGFWYNAGTAAAPVWLRLTDSGGVSYSPATGLQVGPGGSTASAPPTSPFFSYSLPFQFTSERSQFMYPAASLQAAGLRAGRLTQLSLYVYQKNSITPFQNLTLSLATTTAATLLDVANATNDFVTAGLTAVYAAPAGGYSTTVGENVFVFAQPYYWDGRSNLVLDVCFANSTATTTVDYVRASMSSQNRLSVGNQAVASHCNFPPGYYDDYTPMVKWVEQTGYTLPTMGGASGQVLTQQASGAVAFQDPQWTRTSNGLSPFVATDRVGIGTSAPATALDVAGTARATNAVVTTALTGSGADLGTVVGVGIRADGGLNLGQNVRGNLLLGYQAGQQVTTGSQNQFAGYQAGQASTTGNANTFTGFLSGYANSTGSYNSFSGAGSGQLNTGGSNNVFEGYQSGLSNQTGSNNTALGYKADVASGGLANATALGASAVVSQSNSLVLGAPGTSVGIGTGSPQARLEVQGGADSNGASDPVAVAFGYRTGGFRHWLRSRHNSNLTTNDNALDFYLNTGSAAASSQSPGVLTAANPTGAGANTVQVLSLTQNGGSPRVGIGTAAPSQALDVAGVVRSSAGGFQFPDGTIQATAASSTGFIQNTTSPQAGASFNIDGNGTIGGSLRLGVRVLPPVPRSNSPTPTPYNLTPADIATGILKIVQTSQVGLLVLPPDNNGQVEGQELTIINAAAYGVVINAQNTDNSTSVSLYNSAQVGVHAVKYVWILPGTGSGYWVRVQ